MPVPLLQLVHIGCADGDFHMLRDINWALYPGQICRIIGANGSGKSTLLALIGGVRRPTSGQILWNGEAVTFSDPRDALRRGIVLLEEQPHLYAGQSIAENVITAADVTARRVRLLRERETLAACRALFDELGIPLEADRLVDTLTLAQRRLLELARAYYGGVSLLLMDGLAGWSTEEELEAILRLINAIIKKHNAAVVYCVSGFARVKPSQAHATLYLKSGTVVAQVEASQSEQVPLDIQAIHLDYPKIDREFGEPLIEVRDFRTANLSDSPYSAPNSMKLYAGQVVGVYGMDMPHCQALYEIYNGRRHDYGGQILIEGKPVRIQSPRHAQRLGIACQPILKEDALFHNLTLQMNLTPATDRKLFASPRFERFKAASRAVRLHIDTRKLRSRCDMLGSGMRQKVLLSRYLEQNAKIFILFHPTSDMDDSAKLDIYNLMTHLQQRGCGIMLFSSDPDELAYMCDWVYVMRDSLVCKIKGTPSQRAAQLYRFIAGHEK